MSNAVYHTLIWNLILGAHATVISPQEGFIPKAKTFTELGIATDTLLNRDSCGSAKIGNRTLWTCRDTQFKMANGLPQLAVISSTASWADYQIECSKSLPSNTLRLYGDQNGNAYFPLLQDECNMSQAGICEGDSSGSRFSIWPDSAPMVVGTAAGGSVKAYTWIRKFRVDREFRAATDDPASTLYRIDYTPADEANTVPPVSTVDPNFWAEGEISYGNYGNVMRDGVAYLYGQPSNKKVALARVKAESVEDKGRYEYFIDGNWTATRPTLNTAEVDIPNASAGGQGTYYFSDVWKRFVWIGQAAISVGADFFITTSPAPEGPWTEPMLLYRGKGGNYSLGAYSLQAHPALVEDGCNEMIISWTTNDFVPPVSNVYSTPLVRVTWE